MSAKRGVRRGILVGEDGKESMGAMLKRAIRVVEGREG